MTTGERVGIIAVALMALVLVVAWIVPWLAYRDASTEAPPEEHQYLHGYIRTMKVRPLYAQVLEARMGEDNPLCVEGYVLGRTLFGVEVADLRYRCRGESEGYEDYGRAVRAWLAFLGIEGVLGGLVFYTWLIAPHYEWDERGLLRARIVSVAAVMLFAGALAWAWLATG